MSDVKIRFVLREVKLEGNTAVPTKELRPLWTDNLNHEIGLSDLDEVTRRIREYYRSKGFPATRVSLPTQDFASGRVLISVHEFHINKVAVRRDGVFVDTPPVLEPVIAEMRKLSPPSLTDYQKLATRMESLSGIYPLDMRVPLPGDPEVDVVIELSSVPLAQRTDFFQVSEFTDKPPAELTQKRFRLSELVIRGATTFTPDQLKAMWAGMTGKDITLGDLLTVRTQLIEAYRKEGRTVPEILFPSQAVIAGIVTMQVREAMSDLRININGKPAPNSLPQKIASRRPAAGLTQKDLDWILEALDNLPGLKVSDTRIPKVGSGHPEVDLKGSPIAGKIDLDNRGNYMAGPLELATALKYNNPLNNGDRLALGFSTNPALPANLLAGRVAYDTPVGLYGTLLSMRYSHVDSRPSRQYIPGIDPSGNVVHIYPVSNSDKVQAKVTQPLILSHQESLWVHAGLVYANDRTTFLESQSLHNMLSPGDPFLPGQVNSMSNDRLRDVRTGFTNRFRDNLLGSSTKRFGVDASHGLPYIGAYAMPDPTGGVPTEAKFSKVMGDVERITKFGNGVRVTLTGAGLYGYTILPSSQKFSIGGSNAPPYDDGTIAGDRGIGGAVELAWEREVGAKFLLGYEPYVFYDIARTWNCKSPNTNTNSLASGGMGMRLQVLENVSAFVEVARPFTAPIVSPTGRNEKPTRVFAGTGFEF
ncbi:MAG: hypothetical protein HQL37_10995 [Alphaproteobacteria bacterium]|nr:hypothetical protein [Alphaproteobacteria bacterium]